MPRRKRTPEEIARKTKVRELMQELDINDMSDINENELWRGGYRCTP